MSSLNFRGDLEERQVERKVQFQREVDLKEIHPDIPGISDPTRTVHVSDHFRHLPKKPGEIVETPE